MPRIQMRRAVLLPLSLACSLSFAEDHGHSHAELKPCPESPNCVSSLTAAEDEDHAIRPLSSANGNLEGLWAQLKKVLGTMDRVEIIKETPEYIHAEATTLIMRFTDDVEFVKDAEAGVIQVRSASRVGYSDFGANRSRIEDIREALAEENEG